MPSIDSDCGISEYGKNDHTTTIQTTNLSQSSAFSSDLITSVSSDVRCRSSFESTTNLPIKYQ